MTGVPALTVAAAGSALTIRGDMMASEKPPQKRLAIPAPPDEMTPNDALKHINNQPTSVPSMPSPGMVKVIESLLHPENFLSAPNVDHARKQIQS